MAVETCQPYFPLIRVRIGSSPNTHNLKQVARALIYSVHIAVLNRGVVPVVLPRMYSLNSSLKGLFADNRTFGCQLNPHGEAWLFSYVQSSIQEGWDTNEKLISLKD